MAEDSQVVASFQKNSQEEFRFTITSFRGSEYADIRIYYENEGDFLPSRKGITVSPEAWSEFRSCLEKLEAELKRRDLLKDDDGAA